MRLFIAVNFSDEVKSRILKIQDQLRCQASKGSFTRPENLHLTLAFLGETREGELGTLSRILDDIQWKQKLSETQQLPPPPFDILFNHTGCFTHSGKELWWIGAAPDCPGIPLLQVIHGQLVNRLANNGFAVDKRPFNAHITLGREIKHTSPIVLEMAEVITVRVDRVSLMKSEHIRGMLTYTELMGRSL